MENIEVTIEESKEYKIKPFAHITVGDPLYENLPNKDELILSKDLFKSNRNAGLIIQKQRVQFPEFSFGEYHIIAYSAQNNSISKEILDAHKNLQYCPELIKSRFDLGCDSAQFNLEIDGRCDNFKINEDGSFGEFYHYKDNRIYLLDIALPDDLFGIEHLQSIAYIFDCKELKAEIEKNKNRYIKGE